MAEDFGIRFAGRDKEGGDSVIPAPHTRHRLSQVRATEIVADGAVGLLREREESDWVHKIWVRFVTPERLGNDDGKSLGGHYVISWVSLFRPPFLFDSSPFFFGSSHSPWRLAREFSPLT